MNSHGLQWITIKMYINFWFFRYPCTTLLFSDNLFSIYISTTNFYVYLPRQKECMLSFDEDTPENPVKYIYFSRNRDIKAISIVSLLLFEKHENKISNRSPFMANVIVLLEFSVVYLLVEASYMFTCKSRQF